MARRTIRRVGSSRLTASIGLAWRYLWRRPGRSTAPNVPKLGLKFGSHDVVAAGSPLAGMVGFHFDRQTGVYWSEIEPTIGGAKDFSTTDTFVARTLAHGFNEAVFVMKTGHPAGRVTTACRNFIVAAQGGGDTSYDEASCPLLPGAMETNWKTFLKAVMRRYSYGNVDTYPGLPAGFKTTFQIENEQSSAAQWSPDEIGDGPAAYASYLTLLQLSYAAREEAVAETIGLTRETTRIIGGSLHRVELSERCDRIPGGPSCGTDYETRQRYMQTQMLIDPAFIAACDAYDMHYFQYHLLVPEEIQQAIDWVKTKMASVGNTKPLVCYESTGANLIRVDEAGDPDLVTPLAAHFPYTYLFPTPAEFGVMYSNLDDPAYLDQRKWFAGEGYDDIKITLIMFANGFQEVAKVRFHDLYPGSWDNTWWNWNGLFWFYDATPTVLRKPSWYCYQKLLPYLTGATQVAFISAFGAAVTTIQITYNGGLNPVHLAWVTAVDTTAVIAPAAALGFPAVTVYTMPTDLSSWDGLGTPNSTTVTKSGTQTITLTNVPVLIEAA